MSNWRAAYFPTVMSGPVVRFRRRNDRHGPEVSASRVGVLVDMNVPTSGVAEMVRVIEAANRAYIALREAYERSPLRGPIDSFACIQQALGGDWTLDNPRFGDTWPDEPEK